MISTNESTVSRDSFQSRPKRVFHFVSIWTLFFVPSSYKDVLPLFLYIEQISTLDQYSYHLLHQSLPGIMALNEER